MIGFGVNFYFCVSVDIYFVVIGMVSFFNIVMIVNDCCCWEVWFWDVFYQFFNVDVFIINICQIIVDDFCQVVWWDVGCYIYGDIGRIVYQQVRNFGWYDVWNFFCVVIVINEIDCFFFEIGYQFMGNFCQMDFCIMYCCCRVVVDRIEVILIVYQYIMQ